MKDNIVNVVNIDNADNNMDVDIRIQENNNQDQKV